VSEVLQTIPLNAKGFAVTKSGQSEVLLHSERLLQVNKELEEELETIQYLSLTFELDVQTPF